MGKRNPKGEWFLQALAEGYAALDNDTAYRMSEQLNFSLNEKYFCVVARYKHEKLFRTDINMTVLLHKACLSAIKNLEGYPYSYIGNQFYVVMIIAEVGTKTKVISKLKEDVEKRCGQQIQFGVGRSYEELERLNYSRVEAYEALANIGEQEVVYSDDLYVTQNITARKLDKEKQRIILQFKCGDLRQLIENVNQLVEKVRLESPVREGAPYPTSIRRTIIELLVEILHFCADVGVDVDKELNYQDPYRKVFELTTTPDILKWFSEIILQLHTSLQERQAKSENNMLILAKKSINEHISDPQLSLLLISNELRITPTYLSAFFIREMGMGFNEYISTIRIEYAKELLLTTNQKVNEIAEECGFSSASYFNVVFRKQVGVSPGAYRNTKKYNKC